MLEYPEIRVFEKQLNQSIIGLTISKILPPTKPHKFCWFSYDVTKYHDYLINSKVTKALGFGLYVEITFDNGYSLAFNDGVYPKLINETALPDNYQLAIIFTNHQALVFNVRMYGSIFLHKTDLTDKVSIENIYYQKSIHAFDLLASNFNQYFMETLNNTSKTISLKAFLATEQRFMGLGNGVLQDILFEAKLYPRRKLNTLNNDEIIILINTIKKVLNKMIVENGRNTETDLYGNFGQYQTKMTNKTLLKPCPNCLGRLNKETYLGGAIYYCPQCQK